MPSASELNAIEGTKMVRRLDAAAAAICERRNAGDWPCNGLDFDEEMARVALAAADAVLPPLRFFHLDLQPFDLSEE